MEGVLAIDPAKCDGCGACVEACPYGAIKIVNGKAVKCDLCVFAGGEPRCVLSGAARVVYTNEEIEEMGNALGWLILESGEFVVDIERPRLWEARLVREVSERYEKLRGKFSWEEILAGLEYEMGEIPEAVKKSVLWWLRLTYEENGPLSLLNDAEIEEIAVTGLKKPIRVYVRGKGWMKTNLAFWTEEYFLSVVNRIAAGVSRRLTTSNARISAVLPDGSRLHAIIPPLSVTGHTLTIRRFSTRPFTPWDLIELGTVDPETLALIWLFIDEEMNVVIAGNTGSGKTTTLNALTAFIPLDERIIIVEETPEIRPPHEHVVRLIPSEGTSMQDLVYDTLRMRPDRIIVGEVRRPGEFRALFDTMLAGQGKGSYATMHGRSVEETVRRILSMGIPESDLLALDLIVIQRRRRGRGQDVRRIEALGVRGKMYTGIADVAAALEMDPTDVEREIRERAAFLRRTKVKDLKAYAEAVEAWRRR